MAYHVIQSILNPGSLSETAFCDVVSNICTALLCGGVAGAFSKTCTAPLARITILRQLQSTGIVPGMEVLENKH